MIQQVLGGLDYSFCAEMSLLGFLSLFVVLTIRTLLRDRRDTADDSRIVLRN